MQVTKLTIITFDTCKFINRLIEASFEDKQVARMQPVESGIFVTLMSPHYALLHAGYLLLALRF